ncbi:MAG: glycosyltransferase family 2 protein, partial [Gemmatimonadales bacterium]
AVGGFDVSTTNAADVEDIDLGYRLRDAGYRIVLDPTLEVAHHKRYRIRDLVRSDLFHRAVPWTRAIIRHHRLPGRGRLNLSLDAAGSAVLSLALVAGTIRLLRPGNRAWPLLCALALTWLALNRRFLWFCRRHWGWRGMAQSTGFLYVYYLSCVCGAGLGLVAHFLRHGRRSTLNTLDVPCDGPHATVDVTVAVIAEPGGRVPALAALAGPSPWCEVLVVCPSEPGEPLPGARWLRVAPGTTRHGMYQRALEAAVGEMFVTLDPWCMPEPGWLDAVRATASGSAIAVAGAFQHDRSGVRRRANQIALYWEWRPERPSGYLFSLPVVNTAFRSKVARSLGGFQPEGALQRRLAAFGARPARLEPRMLVSLVDRCDTESLLGTCAARARLAASLETRYLDLSIQHRAVVVALSPVSGLRQLTRTVREAVREGSADRTFWLALP